jgi:hypothetical protein
MAIHTSPVFFLENGIEFRTDETMAPQIDHSKYSQLYQICQLIII